MKQFNTQGIILTRTNFGEADRIITFITPDHGKVKAIAKAVRKSSSKLAGGVELFSVSELAFVNGRGEVRTLIHSRLIKHYGNIVKDLERTQTGYELMRILSRATEDAAEAGYFNLLNESLSALDNEKIDLHVLETWFDMQLLKLAGHMPNLDADIDGVKLKTSATYNFNIERMRFALANKGQGRFKTDHIKFLRVGFAAQSPRVLQRIQGCQELLSVTQPVAQAMLKTFVRI